jgi:diguanylate cyclase (GGDEF)-like protein/PAS domain S-box-containing protein
MSKRSTITRRVSLALGCHAVLVLGYSLVHLVNTTNPFSFIHPDFAKLAISTLALSLGVFSLSWFLPNILPNYSRQERNLATSLSDTRNHLKSLYSLSSQGVILVHTKDFEINQANPEAKRVISLINNGDDSCLPHAFRDHLTRWMQNNQNKNILTLPSQNGAITLTLEISSFAMEESPALLVQFKEVDTHAESLLASSQQTKSFEVQLIEEFDDLLNLPATSAHDLLLQIARKLADFNILDSLVLLQFEDTERSSLCQVLYQGQEIKLPQQNKSDFESRILNKDQSVQLYSRATELRLPECILNKVENNSSLSVVNLDDQLGKQFSLLLFTNRPSKLNSAVLALFEQLRTQLSYRINQLSQSNIQKQNVLLQKQLTTIIESSANAIILTNTDFIIEYINPKLCQTSGYNEQQLVGHPFSILCPIEDNPLIHRSIRDHVSASQPWYGEVVQRDRHGHLRWSNLQLTYMQDEHGDTSHYIIHLEDKTELYQAQDEINQLTHFDPLTNLPNRNLFTLRMKSAIEENIQEKIMAVMYLDLDGFKHINDSLGHHNGDRLLKHIAERLSELLSPNDTLARLGGDEFAILIPDVLAKGSIVNLVEQMLNTISLPTIINDNSVVITGSIGITLFPQDSTEVDDLQRNADLAMYQAKKEQGNSFHIYTPDLNAQAVQRLDMEHRLRQAIQNDKLTVYFQPQVDIQTEAIIGAEALVRWFDEDLGFVSPVQFIPLAEETGLIAELGNQVLLKSCQYTREFLKYIDTPFKVAINLSGYQFKRPDQLLAELDTTLHDFTLPPECIELELTESMLMENVQSTKETLTLLHDQGISLAIDDFGTGYSSLSYLKEFPIDKLKVDRSFIKDINHNRDDAAITSAVIAMAHKLGLTVLAEGVENKEQLQFLTDHSCDYIQGFYFSKPLPATEFIDLLQQGTIEPTQFQKQQ